MKKSFIFIAALLAAVNTLVAQDCKTYYYLHDKAEVEMSVYDSKSTVVAKNIYNVLDVKKDGNGLTSDFTSTVKDASGKEISSGKGKFKCDGANLLVDMQMNMPNIPQLQNMKMENTSGSSFLTYPSSLAVGQTLPEGSFEVNGENNMGLQYKVANRKVAAKEKVTTAAGTWDCFKITYDMNIAVKMMGMSMPFNLTGVEWFAPGFGLVKMETAKDGSLLGSMAITAYKK